MTVEKQRYINYKFPLRTLRILRGKNKNPLIISCQNGINNHDKNKNYRFSEGYHEQIFL